MAPDHVFFIVFDHDRIFVAAFFRSERTPSVEAAPGGKINRTRYLTLGRHLFRLVIFFLLADYRYRREEHLGVRVLRVLKKLSVGAISAIRPRYIMATRSATFLIRLKS